VAKKVQNAKASASNGANVNYEAELWRMADALRGGRKKSYIDAVIAFFNASSEERGHFLSTL
jgi:hypothetical protein